MDNVLQDEDKLSDSDSVISTNLKRKSNGLSRQAKKKSKNELYKAPTADELHQLKETENLFNSNLFRLQIEELLQEVNVKQKLRNKFELWFKEFTSFLSNISEYDDVLLSKLKVTKGKKQFINKLAASSKLDLKCDLDLLLKFVKPECCEVIGFYKSDCIIGPNLNVHVAVQMPRVCFHEKDYLNNRYLVKRHYYLLYLMKELTDTEICSKILYSFSDGIDLLPILNITPNVSEKISVKVFIVPFSNYFKPSRFLPSKNNVKAHVFGSTENINEEELKNHGTPYYNTILLHDITLSLNNSFCDTTLSDFKSAKDAVKLIQVWTKQRDLSSMDKFLFYSLAYLACKRKINKHMSSYQVIRNLWFFLSKTDLTKENISICEDVKPNIFDEFRNNFDVVFLDTSGCYNLAAFINFELYNKIKSEATLAVQFLDSSKFNSFQALFMTKVPFVLQYDLVLRLESYNNFDNIYKTATDADKISFLGVYSLLIVKTILHILKKGLNKRVTQVVALLNKSESSFSELENPSLDTLTFGISLDMDNAFSNLELGPHPHDFKVKDFMEFWGEWSQLRRFPDGSMCEAVYFEAKTIRDRRNVIKKIIEYVVTEKMQLEHSLYFSQFESVLAPPNLGTNEEVSLKAITTSDALGKVLRSLTLPLDITTNLGLSDVFSYTDPFPPKQINYKWKKKFTETVGSNLIFNENILGAVPGHLAPIECVLHLSIHSKWPNDLEAIRNVKTAFYLKIAELLDKEAVTCRVCPDYLDVYYHGFLFRYKIFHPKEVSFLKRGTTTDGVVVYRDTKESMELEEQLEIKPKIQGALKGIQSQYPSYGVSTSLIKRWLRSQLIDSYYISDEVINLLNASLYLNSAPFLPPALPQVGFLRFLKFMAETDWMLQSVVVNFNEEITKEKLDQLETDFNRNRQNYPNLYIITPYDDGKSIFTRIIPGKEILWRIKELAGECYKIVCSIILEGTALDVLPLFTPNLDGYNVVIHLNTALNARRNENIKNIQKIVEDSEEYDEPLKNSVIPIVDFNPVDLYLKELRCFYNNLALFFHDTHGGDTIGILWKPDALQNKDFKLSHTAGRCVTTDGKLSLNIDALIEDFRVLGKGLVRNIDKN